MLQARGLSPAQYEVIREAGPDHQKTFWVKISVPDLLSATGVGTNKKEAEQSAAEQALEQLQFLRA
jgi:ribonuclease-3